MRKKRTFERSLFSAAFPETKTSQELSVMDQILDQFSEFLTWIADDLDGTDPASHGREGLTCEVVLRAGILKQRSSLSYRQLEHQLADSRAAQNFARVDPHAPPKRAALHKCISAVTAHTWERINKRILKYALDQKIELGHKVRIDSTVTESNILAPMDSRLLFDGVRVLTALLEDAGEALGRDVIKYRSHLRAAKRRVVEISGARGEKRKALYRKLLALARNTIGYADGALATVAGLGEDLKRDEDWLAGWEEAVKGSCGLVGKKIDGKPVSDISEKAIYGQKLWSLGGTIVEWTGVVALNLYQAGATWNPQCQPFSGRCQGYA